MDPGGARALSERIARHRAAKEQARRIKEGCGQRGDEPADGPPGVGRGTGTGGAPEPPDPEDENRRRIESEGERSLGEFSVGAQRGELQSRSEVERLRAECERLRRLHAALVEERRRERERAVADVRELQGALGAAVGRVAAREREVVRERAALAETATALALRRRRLILLRTGRKDRAADAAAALASREETARGQEANLRERETALSGREGALVERQHALADREEIVRANEQALVGREQALAQREQALARREALLDERLGRELAVAAPGRPYDLFSLDTLVHERSHEFPERLEEWQAYLFHLRVFADERGLLPTSFDGLVAEVFADLLAAHAEERPTAPRPASP